ncbi:hypothetical protein N7495_008420 [Penicillium taxi]|uniref:uncharacterized protein n=1 Tax=Penicillium taxi TaxID=168475 RepID=UPI0025455DDF|nr:uncharacterized protein N7495_008420 [Penicillium taxi]KAJ5888379.1 hypothetical protein N7495_008420 [Penicillium taxi]
MDSMSDMETSCKISMLWNWHTIDACFISNSWHIRSTGNFAGACIGAILLVVCLEFLRRLGREYDAFVVRRARLREMYLSGSVSGLTSQTTQNSHTVKITGDNGDASDGVITSIPDSNSNGKDLGLNSATVVAAASSSQCENGKATTTLGPYRPSLVEQLIRALLHTMQFAVAYIVMLLAMYFNGYIIICIFIGAFLGSFIFSWEPVTSNHGNDATAVTKCCG